jgi:GTP-binding protein HflX
LAVSAITGEGLDTLLARFEAEISHDNIGLTLSLEASDGAGLAWAYRHAEVIGRQERAGRITLSLQVSPQNAARFQDRFPKKIKISQSHAA